MCLVFSPKPFACAGSSAEVHQPNGGHDIKLRFLLCCVAYLSDNVAAKECTAQSCSHTPAVSECAQVCTFWAAAVSLGIYTLHGHHNDSLQFITLQRP